MRYPPLLPFACLGLLAACGKAPPESTPLPPLVRVFTIGPVGFEHVQSYTGSIQARVEADLGFRVAGKITERLVDTGAAVRLGQPLFRLDGADLALEAAAATDRVRAAEAEAARAASDERRQRFLVARGAVSEAEYDAALASARSAASNLAAARSSQREASNQAQYGTLCADSDGVVSAILAQPGQVVAAGAAVLRLARSGPRELAIAVPEAAKASLPQSGTVSLYGSAATGIATRREISAVADPATRTFAARYRLEGGLAQAPLGATATIALASDGPVATAVPLAALTETGGQPSVWVIEPEDHTFKVRRRQVRVAAFGDESAELSSVALRTGDRIVALGANLLRDGELVRIADAGLER